MKALFTAILLAATASLAAANSNGTAKSGNLNPDTLSKLSPHSTTSGLYHNVYAPTNKSGLVKMVLCKPKGANATRLNIYSPTGRLEYTTLVSADSALRTFDFKDMERGAYKFEFRNGADRVVDEVVVR